MTQSRHDKMMARFADNKKALEAALAQPEQVDCPRCGHVCSQREWVGLTNEEIAEILCDDRWQMRPELMLLACQAKLKERNT